VPPFLPAASTGKESSYSPKMFLWLSRFISSRNRQKAIRGVSASMPLTMPFGKPSPPRAAGLSTEPVFQYYRKSPKAPHQEGLGITRKAASIAKIVHKTAIQSAPSDLVQGPSATGRGRARRDFAAAVGRSFLRRLASALAAARPALVIRLLAPPLRIPVGACRRPLSTISPASSNRFQRSM
jgi:hypothetical protein